MRLKRPILEHRMKRITLRANADAPVAAVLPPVARISSNATIARHEPAAPKACRRRSCRRPVDHEVGVKKLGGLGFQLATRDVSPDGCRVELVEMVDIGERVIVRLPSIEPLGAEVAWVKGANAGLQFQRPLHPAVFEQLIDRVLASAS